MASHENRGRGRASWLAAVTLCSSVVFAMVYLTWLVASGLLLQSWSVIAIVGTKAVIEIIASVYAIAFFSAAVAYLATNDDEPLDTQPMRSWPRVAIVYLCCGDLDLTALRSLATTLQYDGELTIVVHDDAIAREDREAVDAAVRDVANATDHRVQLLRRPQKAGGKPGAVNFVLDQIRDVDWFLLCDNDSLALEPDTIQNALRRGHDPSVAIVQFRTVGIPQADDSAVNRRLTESINAFHLFLWVWSRFAWMPFIGHNALLRMSAVRAVGGLTPGFFADDIDLTVRLNMAGYTVVYAPEIRMGETHPSSYAALRKRTYKWAYGCVQVLKTHARQILTSPRLTFAEKLGFIQFAGFYVGQVLLLGYLCLTFIVSPFVLPTTAPPVIVGLLLGSAIVVGIFLPVLAYFARERRLVASLGTVLLLGAAYGAMDFVCVRGIWDAVRCRVRNWVPTNIASPDHEEGVLFAEAAFGALLLLIPLRFNPQMLWVPSAYLFAGKFLFSPSIGRWYTRDMQWEPKSRRRFATVATIGTIATIIGVLTFAAGARAASPSSVEARGRSLMVDGMPFLVKGVHYGPWRPGTGPGKQYPYPDRAAIDGDLSLLAQVHANTILVFDAPDYLLDVAQDHGLRVIYTFNINWWGLPLDSVARDRIVDRVRALQKKPALLAWILGNEVPSAVIDAKGADVVVGEVESLYRRIKAVDPAHPISHSNWVTAKDLPLSFLDFASFNVYPLWPPQVVALGYDGYIRRILRPIAGDKPLLITEFGVNTLEAGEAEQGPILTRTWQALRTTDAAGGVVMEFADEWWKNYDNPRNPRDWWDRAFAQDDELKHDNDPEEYYGLVTAERKPKPAFAVVQRMFATQESQSNRIIPMVVVAVLMQTSVIAWAVAWRTRRRRSTTTDG